MAQPWRTTRLSIGTKISLAIVACVALVITVSAVVVVKRFQVKDAVSAKAIAAEHAAHISGAVQTVFDGAFDIINTTHDNLIALKDAGIVDPRVYDTLLKQMIESDGDRYGAWFSWDSEDAPLDKGAAARSRRDTKGRFASYWHQNGMDLVRDAMQPELYESPLYLIPRESKQAYLLEPHPIEAENGVPTLVTSFAKPVEYDGKIIGVLAVDLKLDAIATAIASIRTPDGASLAVISDGGMVAMSTSKELVGRAVATINPRLLQAFEKARHGDGSSSDTDAAGASVLTSWSAVRFAGIKAPWYLVLNVPERSLISATGNDRAFLLAVIAGALTVFVLLMLTTMSRLVSRPLKGLSNVINGLGRGDLGADIPGLHRRDEVGDISRAVQSLRDSGQEITRLQRDGSERDHRQALARRQELENISAQFSRSVESMVVKLGSVAATVRHQSRDVADKTQTALDRLTKVSEASRSAQASMVSTATATATLFATIGSIGEQTKRGASAAELVERNASLTDDSIRELTRTVQAIDTIAALIRDIAGQINLIALNATIEAARAGEAGLGFSVVAQEIKALAAQTANATTEIGRLIDAVHKASGKADGNVAAMKTAFVEMRSLSSSVAGALDLQLNATDDINDLAEVALKEAGRVGRHVAEMSDSSQQVESAADVMLAQSGSLNDEIGRLQQEISNFLQFLDAA